MDRIKTEIRIVKPMCHGCLSDNRNLQRLQQNTELYFMLLNNSAISPDDLTIINILLCWECIALLRKIKAFQNQIQVAQQCLRNQCILNNKNVNTKLKSLSCLETVNKSDFDSTYNADEIEVKLEWELTKTESKCSEVKEELAEDAEDTEEYCDDPDVYNESDIYNTHDIQIDTEGILNDTKNIPKLKNSKCNKEKLKPNTSRLDMSKIDMYISKVTYTIKELEILSKEKFDAFNDFPKRFSDRFKKLNDMKATDIRKIAKSEEPYTCSYCNAEFTQDTLLNHWGEHQVVFYKCELCNKRFIHYSDLPVHMRRSHHNVYTCTVCGISFSLLREYNSHYRELHKKLVCDHCGRHFSKRRSIEKHMRCNHLPAKCDICNLSFEKYEKLRKHHRHHHMQPFTGVQLELCYCVECNKQYPHMDAYKQHLRNAAVHRPKKILKIPCPDCDRVFSRSTYMKNHYRLMHVKQSKHYCQLCDKFYINAYALRTHRKYVHEKAEKPRSKICDICGKSFNATRTLVNHRRTHTGERPYQCPHCPAAFAQLSAQKTHSRTQHKYLK